MNKTCVVFVSLVKGIKIIKYYFAFPAEFNGCIKLNWE